MEYIVYDADEFDRCFIELGQNLVDYYEQKVIEQADMLYIQETQMIRVSE